MIRWKIKHAAQKAGINNAHQLASASGISYPTAWRLWQDTQEPVSRIDTTTLMALAGVLKVKNPLSLLEYVAD